MRSVDLTVRSDTDDKDVIIVATVSGCAGQNDATVRLNGHASDRVTALEIELTKTESNFELVGAKGTAVLPIRANPAVARGTLWAPFNQGGRAI